MKLVGFLGWISAVTLAVACGASGADGDDGDDNDGNPSGGNTPQEVASCKDSCDQLKFFKCNDAQDQADCYDDCAGADSDQIELFVACVTNDTCDPECSTFIEPSNPSGGNPSGGNQGGGNPSGGNQGGATCASDGCNNPDTECNQACEDLQFFSCIDAATFDDCSALCMSASDEAKGTFASCVSSAGSTQCNSVDCYYTFNPDAVPGPTPQQIADCKMTCEQLGFFDCLSGPDAALCASDCEDVSQDVIEAFLVCVSSPSDCTAALECFQ